MKNVLYDKMVDQKFRYFDGKPFILNYYEVTKAPDNIRCIEDLLFLVVRKYGVSLDMVEGSDKEGSDPLGSFVIKVPVAQAVNKKLSGKYSKWLDDPDSVDLNPAEEDFFNQAKKRLNKAGKPLPISKIPLTLGQKKRDPDELSPINMEGFPED